MTYDYTAAWNNPIKADKTAYLTNRTGMLTQAAPNIGPMVSMRNPTPPRLERKGTDKKETNLLNNHPQMWDVITVSDGTTRQLQYTSRVQADTSKTKSTRKSTYLLQHQHQPTFPYLNSTHPYKL